MATKVTKKQLEKMRAAATDLVKNTDKFKERWDKEARKEHPEMTEEQLQAAWDQLAHQFGL